MLSIRARFICGAYLLLVVCSPVLGQEALHVRIDQLMDAAAIAPAAPVCADHEYIRRVMLDLVGVIPTAAETRAFVVDPAPNKRELLVDRLLADPRHPLHMASVFSVMWMERRTDKYVPAADWLKYLQESFEQNKPYDQLVKELLTADSSNPATKPRAKFLLDRDGDPHLLTRDVGRMFFGVDMQCAQCHDHPLIDDYVQTDYYGLYAFLNRTGLFIDMKDTTKGYLTEKAEGVAEYKSVFTGNSRKTRPRLIGEFELDEPRIPAAEEYTPASLAMLPPVPKFSRRAFLATALGDGSNVAFRRNIANRLWAQLMGRGLVHPVDLHHPNNPPSHPEVLNLLTDEIHAVKFNMRAIWRELALTKVYQRTIDVPTEVSAPANTESLLAAWKTEEDQFRAAADAAKNQHAELLTQLTEANKTLVPLEEALSKAETALTAAKKPYDDAQAALRKAEKEQSDRKTALVAVNEALSKGTEAAKLLTNDNEVTQAVAVFQARVQKLTGEIETANKTIADLMPPVQAALAKLNEAQQVVDAAYTPLWEARKPIDELKVKIITAENLYRAQWTLAQQRMKKSLLLQTELDIPKKKTAIALADTAISTAQAEEQTAKQSVEVQVAEVTKLTTAMTEASNLRATAQQLVTSAKEVVDAHKSKIQAVADAVQKTADALKQLTDDADLKTALEKLKSRQESLTKDLAPLEQTMASKSAEEQAMAAKEKAALDAVAAGQTELANRQQQVEAKHVVVTSAVEQKSTEIASLNAETTQLTTGLTADFSVRDLKAMSPEQMCWSILQSCGIIESYRSTSDAELEKTLTKASVENDPVQKAKRAYQVELMTREKLQSNLSAFATFYGAAPGQPQDDFFATADQALFLANGGTVRGWIIPGTILFDRLNGLMDPPAFAEELYLSVLTRRPTETEVAAVTNMLAARPNERTAVIQELVWALLASAEFRFLH